VLVLAGFHLAEAQPALTTIQDILYRADGTRFSGTMFIRWNSFLSGDTSNIATSDLTLQIVNGVLNVKLVPTTTATPGAQYAITYNFAGKTQFTETWAVPPSGLALRVRDVRTSSGSVVGPSPVTAPVQINDIVGLSNALNTRPTQGVGFAPSRAAIINSAGQFDAAAGNLGDCVRVDGTSGPCGGSGGSGLTPLFVDDEVPAGTVDGVNAVFTLTRVPSPVGSLELYRNGLQLRRGTDYSVAGFTVTFFVGSIPGTGDLLMARYRYADASNPLSTLASPQVVCSSVGSANSTTTLNSLGTCTLPAGLLGTGDRIEVQFHFDHTGTATAFTGEVRWGGTTLLSRSGASGDGALRGRATVGVYSGGQSWDVQSWSTIAAQTAQAGSSAENTAASVTISLYGAMAGATADSVVLRNFSVVRYPAQTNP
jgi:hypothetical protein